MFCAKFGGNGTSGSGDDFKHFVRNLLYFLSLLGKGRDSSFESSLYPFFQMMLWEKFFFEIGSVVLENKILLVQCIYAILLLYLPWKRA